MLFQPRHRDMILAGQKTQTRRIWKRPMARVGGVYWAQTALFKPESRFARIKVTGLWTEQLWDISEGDAHAEGYPDKEAYLDAFCEINKINRTHVNLRRWVTCVTFEVM